jgi:hypothetical protein
MLYNKQLNSIEELRAERLSLKKNAQLKRQLTEEKDKAQDDDAFLAKKISSLTARLMGNSKYAELANTIVEMAMPILLKQVASKTARQFIRKATSELLFGYAKWKAISLVTNLIIKKMKEKKEA